MNINTLGKQEKLAKMLADHKDWYIVGGVSDDELAVKILSALEQMEADEFNANLCANCEKHEKADGEMFCADCIEREAKVVLAMNETD